MVIDQGFITGVKANIHHSAVPAPTSKSLSVDKGEEGTQPLTLLPPPGHVCSALESICPTPALPFPALQDSCEIYRESATPVLKKCQ